MRRLGHAVVDMLVDRMTDTGSPPIVRATREEMERRLREPPPQQGQPAEGLLRQLGEDVLPFALRMDHPRTFAYITRSIRADVGFTLSPPTAEPSICSWRPGSGSSGSTPEPSAAAVLA